MAKTLVKYVVKDDAGQKLYRSVRTFNGADVAAAQLFYTNAIAPFTDGGQVKIEITNEDVSGASATQGTASANHVGYVQVYEPGGSYSQTVCIPAISDDCIVKGVGSAIDTLVEVLQTAVCDAIKALTGIGTLEVSKTWVDHVQK